MFRQETVSDRDCMSSTGKVRTQAVLSLYIWTGWDLFDVK